MENDNSKKIELEKKQKELEEEREKWVEDKNEKVSDKLIEKVKKGKEEFLSSYMEVAKKQSDASSSKFSKRSVKDEKKESGKQKKKVRSLMGDAHLDGRTGRLPKNEQFEKMEKNIEESVNIDQEIMKINRRETWFSSIFSQGTEQEETEKTISQTDCPPKL